MNSIILKWIVAMIHHFFSKENKELFLWTEYDEFESFVRNNTEIFSSLESVVKRRLEMINLSRDWHERIMNNLWNFSHSAEFIWNVFKTFFVLFLEMNEQDKHYYLLVFIFIFIGLMGYKYFLNTLFSLKNWIYIILFVTGWQHNPRISMIIYWGSLSNFGGIEYTPWNFILI